MTDQEVGKLWRLATQYGFHHSWGDIANLIRILVKERGRFYAKHHPSESWITLEQGNDLALRDLGIDPDTWPKEDA